VKRIYKEGFESKLSSQPSTIKSDGFKPYLDIFAKYRQTNRMLDIGCFTGSFLVAAKNQGWKVEGTEISEPAAKFAQDEHNLSVYVHNLETGIGPLPTDTFDVITLFDVIEHVQDPPALLSNVMSLLRPGGLVFADTPNYGSIVRMILGKEWSVFFPWHRYYFTKYSLELMFTQTGYKITRIESFGVKPFSRANVYRRLLREHSIVPHSAGSGSRRKIAPKNKLLVSAFKKLVNTPIYLFTKLGVFWGTKLVVYAIRPDKDVL
jgi:2-polyprenyl-3-methyl-5-hydroxy-6-metoxy-1,4-benzoquinol methylase